MATNSLNRLGLIAPIIGSAIIEGGLLYVNALKVDGWEGGLLAFVFIWVVIVGVIGSVVSGD